METRTDNVIRYLTHELTRQLVWPVTVTLKDQVREFSTGEYKGVEITMKTGTLEFHTLLNMNLIENGNNQDVLVSLTISRLRDEYLNQTFYRTTLEDDPYTYTPQFKD